MPKRRVKKMSRQKPEEDREGGDGKKRLQRRLKAGG